MKNSENDKKYMTLDDFQSIYNLEPDIPIAVCPKCQRLPTIKILEESPGFINISCRCSIDEKFSLFRYLSFIRNISINQKNKTCQKNLNHKISPSFYCKECKLWMCKLCYLEHNHKDNQIINVKALLNNFCDLNNHNKRFLFYCTVCNKHISEIDTSNICYYHESSLYGLISMERHFKQQYLNYNAEAEENLKKCFEKIKEIINKFIKKNRKQNLELELDKNYKIFCNRNLNILTLNKILIGNYNKNFPNYIIESNISNGLKYKFASIEKKIDEIKEVTQLNNFLLNCQIYGCEKKYIGLDCIKTLNYHDNYIYQIKLLSNNKLASCSNDGTIKIIDSNNFDLLLNIITEGKNGRTGSTEYIEEIIDENNTSKDFITIVSCTLNTLKFWKIYEKEYELYKEIENAHQEVIHKIVFFNLDYYVNINSNNEYKENYEKYVLDYRNNYQKKKAGENSFINYDKFISANTKQKRNSKFLATCSRDKTIKFWDPLTFANKSNIVGNHICAIMSILFIKLNNNDYLISGNGATECSLKFWKIWVDENENFKYQLDTVISGVKCCFKNSLIKLNEKKLAVGGYRRISIINLEKFYIEKIIFNEYFEFVACFNILSDNKIICGCGDEEYGKFYILNFNDYNGTLYENRAHDKGINTILFIGEKKIITCSYDTKIKIFDLKI